MATTSLASLKTVGMTSASLREVGFCLSPVPGSTAAGSAFMVLDDPHVVDRDRPLGLGGCGLRQPRRQDVASQGSSRRQGLRPLNPRLRFAGREPQRLLRQIGERGPALAGGALCDQVADQQLLCDRDLARDLSDDLSDDLSQRPRVIHARPIRGQEPVDRARQRLRRAPCQVLAHVFYDRDCRATRKGYLGPA